MYLRNRPILSKTFRIKQNQPWGSDHNARLLFQEPCYSLLTLTCKEVGAVSLIPATGQFTENRVLQSLSKWINRDSVAISSDQILNLRWKPWSVHFRKTADPNLVESIKCSQENKTKQKNTQHKTQTQKNPHQQQTIWVNRVLPS